MVHPHSGNTVSVALELTGLVTDYGRIGSVKSHALEVIEDHLADTIGICKKKSQAILPQVSPSSSASSVVVVRQEGASEYTAQLGLEARISRYFDIHEMIPAAGQGILAIQGRAGEEYPWLGGILDAEAAAAALCERAFARTLGGGCTSPVCAHAWAEDGKLRVLGLYYDENSGCWTTGEAAGETESAEDLGKALACKLRSEFGKEAEA